MLGQHKPFRVELLNQMLIFSPSYNSIVSPVQAYDQIESGDILDSSTGHTPLCTLEKVENKKSLNEINNLNKLN